VSLDLSDNPLGDPGVSLLAAAPNAAGLTDLGLCATDLGDRGLAALAESPHLSNLRSLDVRGHHSTFGRTPGGYDVGGLADLARSPLLGQLRRLLVDWNGGPGNGWAAVVLAFARPPRRATLANAPWIADRLRKSPYLVPSLLVECDLADLWWLGDTRTRERLPSWWAA
jgi:hypothetical protein